MPFVSRKVVHVEQGKPHAGLSVENGEPKINGERVDEESIVNLSVKDLVQKTVLSTIEETTDEQVVAKPEPEPVAEPVAEPVLDLMVEFAPTTLRIEIPVEEVTEPVERIPEFRNNANSESVAIKKFNRRHRKHNP